MLVSGDEEVQQVCVAHAVYRRNDELAELKLRVVPGDGKGRKRKEDKTREEKTTRRTTAYCVANHGSDSSRSSMEGS